MNLHTEVLIIGGGLAGLSSAIHLCNSGKQVVLLEQNSYPQHKVCGEYISNEVLPYLNYLKVDTAVLLPCQISRLQVSSISGNYFEHHLPLGGFGISRHRLDEHLYRKALDAGCVIIQERVKAVHFSNNVFEVQTSDKSYHAKIVLGAFGKRAQLDHSLQRSFIKSKSPWLAIKAHYKGEHASDLVALHNFVGGYCGVSKIENDIINICYLAKYDSFKKFKNIDEYQKHVLYQNPRLKKVFQTSECIFETPLTISQISFEQKEQVKDHILMIGDTAGLIHPLCGNGMSMAIHAAGICSSLVLDYLNGKIDSRAALENRYSQQWNAEFRLRIQVGRILSRILLKPQAAEIVMNVLTKFPVLFKPMIKFTHGRPLLIR